MGMSADQIVALHDAHVLDQDGQDVGEVDQVFLDADTDEPAWVTIGAGLFGGHERFVPLAGAEITDTQIRVPYTKKQISGAPRFAAATEGADGADHNSDDENPYRYYGLDVSSAGINEHVRPGD